MTAIAEHLSSPSQADRTTPSVQATARPPLWYRDTVSCLHATVGSVLQHRGTDPLDVLGAGWGFTHLPDEDPFEEFYFASPPGRGLGWGLAPHQPLDLEWRVADEADPVSEIAAVIRLGQLPIVALDKYHLPFRPAYHDIHAAYLLVVYGVDLKRGLVLVSDPTPPQFTGPIPLRCFVDAWCSPNPADVQDAFFSETEIGRRYLLLDAEQRFAALTPESLAQAMRTDTARFRQPGGETAWTGLDGLERYLAAVNDAAATRDTAALRKIYPFAWGAQAQASLHGELLRRQGSRWSRFELREAGRAVELAAHTWTALRITAAHHWRSPEGAATLLTAHGNQLRARYETAVDLICAAERTL